MKRERFNWIRVSEALKISGHGSTGALLTFVKNWNAKHPERLILRRPAYIDKGSLERALCRQAELHTPGVIVTAHETPTKKGR